jgi:hypothetical protein
VHQGPPQRLAQHDGHTSAALRAFTREAAESR